MRLAPLFDQRGRQRLAVLDRLLDEEHGAPETTLGNHLDPLDEAVYIILSFQTGLARFQETWKSLRVAFPQWKDAERASVDQISRVLRPGGLHCQKAKAIKRLLEVVRGEFGRLSLDSLRGLADADAERALTRLPGLSLKGERCVLLYSLGREVLPVDGNTFRILLRAGVVPRGAVYRRRALHDKLQAAVPPERRRRFHVNLVVHGQHICLPQRPRCFACPVLSSCPRRGIGLLQSDAVPQPRHPDHPQRTRYA